MTAKDYKRLDAFKIVDTYLGNCAKSTEIHAPTYFFLAIK
jgi:hypothetical protein